MNIIRTIYGSFILFCILLVKVPFVLTTLDKFGNRDLSLADALSAEKDKVCLNKEQESLSSWFKKKPSGSNVADWFEKKKKERERKKLEAKIKEFFKDIPKNVKKCLKETGKNIKKFFKYTGKKIKNAFTKKNIK